MPLTGEWFAVGEGIETVLAVVVSCGIPGWAALSESGIRALVLPPEATHVIICTDHDASGVGVRAAHDAAARWLGEGRHVRIAMPPVPETDFARPMLPQQAGGLSDRTRQIRRCLSGLGGSQVG
jgi:hypothetical protein